MAPRSTQAPTTTASPATNPAERPKSNGALTRPLLSSEALEREVEYVPFLSKDSIKLSVALVLKFICKPTKSGALCSQADAMRFVMLCKARGLNPWEGDAYLVGYDTKDGPSFSLITAHQAFLKRAEVNSAFEGMESGVLIKRPIPNEPDRYELIELPGDFVDPDGDIPVGAWAKVYRSDRKFPIYRRLKLATFNKGYGRWNDDAAGMIVKCAEADALRSAFPNALGGMYLNDEMPGIVEVSRSAPDASQVLQPGRFVLPPSRGTTATQQPAEQPRVETVEPDAEQEQQADPEPAQPDPEPAAEPAKAPAAKKDPPKSATKKGRMHLQALRYLIHDRNINDGRVMDCMSALGLLGDQAESFDLDGLSEDDCARLTDELAKPVPTDAGGEGMFKGGSDAHRERR